MKKQLTLALWQFLLIASVFVQGAEPVGLVVALQGSATATSPPGDSRDLSLSSDIFLNDSIETDSASRLQLLLNDDSLIAQGERSEMTIDEYVYNPDSAADNAFGASLGQGVFRAITGKITDLNPERFSVRTSRANIGIRGCDLGFEITPDEDRISVIVIPDGKQILINPLNGLQSLIIETPAHVTVDDDGEITQRELNTADRGRVQQSTTPGAKEPEETSPQPSSMDSVSFGEEMPFEQNTIIQDTLQGDFHDYH